MITGCGGQCIDDQYLVYASECAGIRVCMSVEMCIFCNNLITMCVITG